MDYIRIYNELVEHRKMLPMLDGVYYERHHIVPECMGGGDEHENLVYLTAEDHFVAHYLLARGHNSPNLWLAVNAMLITREGRVLKNRRSVGIVKREAALARTKNQIRAWQRISDGKIFHKTRTEMKEQFGLPLWATKGLVSGKTKTSKGFCLVGTDLRNRDEDNNVYDFKHIESGRVYSMTRKQMREVLGISRHQVSNMVRRVAKSNGGYCLIDTDMDYENFWPDKNIYRFMNIKSGETISKTRREMTEELGFTSQQLSNIITGYIKSSKGYVLLKEEAPEEASQVVLHQSNCITGRQDSSEAPLQSLLQAA